MSTLLASTAPATAKSPTTKPRSALNEDAVRYGELVQSIYDALIPEEDSDFYNYAMYGKSELFPTLLPEARSRYTITRYIYSSISHSDLPLMWRFSAKNSTTWIGYVAESTPEETQRSGKHEIVVAIRGTSSATEWGKDFTAIQTEFKSFDASDARVSLGNVHKGFLSMYTSKDSSLPFGDLTMKEQILKELKCLVSKYKNEKVKITFVGHSLGAALATLAACDMGNYFSTSEHSDNVFPALFTFGSPRVGDSKFKSIIEKKLDIGGIWRYADKGDIVPDVPPANFFLWKYEHVGQEVKVTPNSPYFLANKSVMDLHNLELYLHCVAANSTTRSKTSPRVLPSSCSLESAYSELKRKTPRSASVIDSVREQFKTDPDSLATFYVEASEALGVTVETDEEVEALYIRASKRVKISKNEDTDSPWDARPYCLVNKSADLLKKQYGIPKCWMVGAFRDMKLVNGKWLDRAERPWDIPTEENNEYN